jgi:hypothetical protein
VCERGDKEIHDIDWRLPCLHVPVQTATAQYYTRKEV